MIIYSKTKADFINDVFNNVLVDELVESLKAKKVPGTGPAHIRSHQNSLRFMDTVLHDAAIPDNAGIAIEYVNPNPAGHGRIPRSSGSRAKRYARQAREGVCRPERVPAMRGESFSRNFPAIPSGETKSRISSLFCGSGKYTATPKDTFDMLVVDEAHRLNEKSGMMQNQGENQVKEIINSAKCSVFFLDEDQKVTRPLPQGYLAWLDNTLQKRETANTQLGAEEYDFRVVDSAAGLRDLIFERNKLSNKARLVAGYCWDDSSVRGYNRKLAADPAAARLEMDALIKNTYKTLMTRGIKGCYVYFTDKETAAYFKTALAPRPAAEAAPQSIAAKLKKLFHVELEVPAALKYVDYLPVYSLEAACGNFGRGMAVEPQGWIKCPPGVKPDHNMFAAKVAGRSMEPRIEDGDYCVFRANVVGSRNNKLVLVQHSSISDPDTGGSYTVKKYTSKKKYNKDGTWQHEEIILKPLNPDYSAIVIPNAEDEEFMVVAEVLSVI